MAKGTTKSTTKSTTKPATKSTASSTVAARKSGGAGAGRKPAAKRAPSPRAIETVLATFAHDIRTPLTGILAFSELLATSGLGERESRWVEAIKDAAGHLTELTTLAVEAARAGAGRLALRRETFALPCFAARLALSLVARAEAKGLACETSIQDDLPDHVAGDPALLRAAIENLVANAVKFTERGQVGLRIAAAPLARGKVRLSFTVSDSGIGMSDAEIGRLFRPFAQASEEIAQRFGGSGLGLVQVRRLARSMHGDLEVESTPGRGSAFHLTVVLDRARPGRGAGPHAAGSGARNSLCRRQSLWPAGVECHRHRAGPPRDLRRRRRGRAGCAGRRSSRCRPDGCRLARHRRL
jgi:two-component system, sensor histidine kinase